MKQNDILPIVVSVFSIIVLYRLSHFTDPEPHASPGLSECERRNPKPYTLNPKPFLAPSTPGLGRPGAAPQLSPTQSSGPPSGPGELPSEAPGIEGLGYRV